MSKMQRAPCLFPCLVSYAVFVHPSSDNVEGNKQHAQQQTGLAIEAILFFPICRDSPWIRHSD